MKTNGKRLNGRWAMKYDCCVECGTTEKHHKGHGLCIDCGNIQYYKNNSAKMNLQGKEYYKKNSEKVKRRCKKYREKNSEEINRKQRDCYKEDPERFLKKSKAYRKKNPEKVNKWRKKYFSKKRKMDPSYKLRMNVSRLINYHLKKRLSSKNGKSTFSFLPYTIESLIQHLESQFKKGMTWQNYGEWHIDHKRPDCSFDYKSVDDKEFQKCWALENLQPLWAIDNIKKGGNWND
jgi:hypothetical protein